MGSHTVDRMCVKIIIKVFKVKILFNEVQYSSVSESTDSVSAVDCDSKKFGKLKQ
jgi:hypothetical protein